MKMTTCSEMKKISLNQYRYEVPYEHSFAFHCPILIKEWNIEKNLPWTPLTTSYGSAKYMWWKCKRNHEWLARVNDRQRGKGHCKICNSIVIRYPELLKEWDYLLNRELPENINTFSTIKYWWKCEKGHSWLSSPYTRTQKNRPNGCPYCNVNNPLAHADYCLSKINPELSKEWSIEDNLPLTPNLVTPGSRKKVWWKCKNCENKWEATINHRNLLGNGCPFCRRGVILNNGTYCDSLVEAYFYLKYKEQNTDFLYHGLYGSPLGRKTYDFYIKNENKYLEVTSFNKKDLEKSKWKKIWDSYYSNILQKKSFVENVLKSKFEFIQIKLDKSQKEFVRKNSKGK